jgi:hypothetical protein
VNCYEEIINVYREANKSDDKPAWMGNEGSSTIVYYEFSLLEVAQDDCRGVSFFRLVSMM